MEHISHRHDFNPADLSTHPQVNSPVQVKYADGSQVEGDWFHGLFSEAIVLPESPITCWRYIKAKTRLDLIRGPAGVGE
jgi:hypothetical protein